MRAITTVAIVGAGTMGSGIAHAVARAGLTAFVHDPVPGALERHANRVRGELDRRVERGRLDAAERDAILARLHPAPALEDIAGCDLVIEAAPEDLELKRGVFRAVEAHAGDAILATNTSTLSVSAIAAALERPERAVGLHFFNPAPVMPLVEVVAGDATAPDVVPAAVAFVNAIGKTPVIARDTPGFIVNRVARPFYGEALRLLGDGGDASVIDRALRGAGFRMGAFELMDLIGLDVNLAATRSVFDAFFGDPKYRPHPIQARLVASGRLGRKSGRGFYEYPEDA